MSTLARCHPLRLKHIASTKAAMLTTLNRTRSTAPRAAKTLIIVTWRAIPTAVPTFSTTVRAVVCLLDTGVRRSEEEGNAVHEGVHHGIPHHRVSPRFRRPRIEQVAHASELYPEAHGCTSHGSSPSSRRELPLTARKKPSRSYHSPHVEDAVRFQLRAAARAMLLRVRRALVGPRDRERTP